jgi:hypothetical protein
VVCKVVPLHCTRTSCWTGPEADLYPSTCGSHNWTHELSASTFLIVHHISHCLLPFPFIRSSYLLSHSASFVCHCVYIPAAGHSAQLGYLPPLASRFRPLASLRLPLCPCTVQIPSGTPRRAEGTVSHSVIHLHPPQVLAHTGGLSASWITATPTAPTDVTVLHQVPTVTYTAREPRRLYLGTTCSPYLLCWNAGTHCSHLDHSGPPHFQASAQLR